MKNHILIAMPHMQDPYFGRAVVLICEHTRDGAMGIIINKPFDEPNLKDLFAGMYLDNQEILKIVPKVYFGGPVMLERGIVLHLSTYESPGTMRVSDEFSITSHRSILRKISQDSGPTPFRLMLGHAGWGKTQLEREIENGDWLLQSTTPDFVFDMPPEHMWKQAAKLFGIETTEISGHTGLA